MKPHSGHTVGVRMAQPPSGGCVLKQRFRFCIGSGCLNPAAFGRLRVETTVGYCVCTLPSQPPSGGCVLKQHLSVPSASCCHPAAFGRLRVETSVLSDIHLSVSPAAFGRLRVETNWQHKKKYSPDQPPSGGCVLKLSSLSLISWITEPAAFGRLRVETVCR